jgi:hypothetical protein
MDSKIYYESGRKKSWRPWKWNRYVERLSEMGKKPKDAIVLYLPGPIEKKGDPKGKNFDPDRKIAIRKGFKNNNLIAINSDSKIITEVRNRGGYAVCGDLFEIVKYWIGEPQVDIIDADLCQGFDYKLIQLCITILTSAGISKEAIIGLNIFRGRDSYGKWLRELTEKHIGWNIKNRAELFYCALLSFSSKLKLYESRFNGVKTLWEWLETPIRNEYENKLYNNYTKIMQWKINPLYYSYRSENSKTYMDTIIFNRPIKIKIPHLKDESNNHIRMKIAAIKAWRTIRMNAA